jgi:hypothetical protein
MIGWISPSTCSRFHGIDAAEKVVVRKQLRRSQVMAFFEALEAHDLRAGRLFPTDTTEAPSAIVN